MQYYFRSKENKEEGYCYGVPKIVTEKPCPRAAKSADTPFPVPANSVASANAISVTPVMSTWYVHIPSNVSSALPTVESAATRLADVTLTVSAGATPARTVYEGSASPARPSHGDTNAMWAFVGTGVVSLNNRNSPGPIASLSVASIKSMPFKAKPC